MILRGARVAAGPNSARSCLICAASMLMGRPLYFPAAFALAMPSRCRSSMISRSQVATPARIVSMSLLVGLRVSSFSPPIDRTTRPMPRFDRSASMDSSSAVLRASRSGLGLSGKLFAQHLAAAVAATDSYPTDRSGPP